MAEKVHLLWTLSFLVLATFASIHGKIEPNTFIFLLTQQHIAIQHSYRLLILLSKPFSKVGILSFTTLGKTFFITFLDKVKYFPNRNGVASLIKVNHKASSIGLLFSVVPPWISQHTSMVSLVRLWQVPFARGTAYSSELASDMEVGNLRPFRSSFFYNVGIIFHQLHIILDSSNQWKIW